MDFSKWESNSCPFENPFSFPFPFSLKVVETIMSITIIFQRHQKERKEEEEKKKKKMAVAEIQDYTKEKMVKGHNQKQRGQERSCSRDLKNPEKSSIMFMMIMMFFVIILQKKETRSSTTPVS